MGLNTKIEWCEHTANLWWGCTQCSPGCNNCYAMALSKRYGHDVWGKDKPRRIIKSVWDSIMDFQVKARAAGRIDRVFAGSMMDIFEKPMPIIGSDKKIIHGITTNDLRNHFFKTVVPKSPNLMFLLLTKRPSNINKYIPASWHEAPPTNVMFGTSPVSQATAQKLITQLLKVNGKKFLSVEPQISELTLEPWLSTHKLDWIIQGGESGPHRRYFNTEWARKLRDECLATGTPYFFKQIDMKRAIPEDLLIREFPKF